MANHPVIYVKTLEEVALLSSELMKAGIYFVTRTSGTEYCFELIGY